MNKKIEITPDYIFEVSWEVCNKVGGIHTVISSKAELLTRKFGDRAIMIGPDVWKETKDNPEFTEDRTLFASWREAVAEANLHVRIGRWNIPGEPVAVLVDITPFFGDKDKILTHFWEEYNLDSISGQWDYIEPVIFGYAAGRVIESFYEYYLGGTDKIIAQFHEWLSAAGILHLHEYVPQAGTVFTTHATTVGRSMTGHQRALYTEIEKINAEEFASSAGIRARFSLESSAAKIADAFTTVSDLTAYECEKILGKEPDIVTPNGFRRPATTAKRQETVRNEARKDLLEVAGAVLNCNFAPDTPLLLTSGRYEVRSKGLDLFIDALSQLNHDPGLDKELIAYIMVPSDHTGPRSEINERRGKEVDSDPISDTFLTHHLRKGEGDAIHEMLAAKGLRNLAQDKVKVIFVPSYLNGNDGVFNKPYYDLLSAADLTVFPSYYEPWGYTPLESVAYGVPTITSDKAGFGLWAQEAVQKQKDGIEVIHRDDVDYEAQLRSLTDATLSYLKGERPDASESALGIAAKATWKNFIKYYYRAYSIALDRVGERSELFMDKIQPEHAPEGKASSEGPEWKKVLVKAGIPEKLEPLEALSRNLWWTWNADAEELFASIDPELWDETKSNPIYLLEMLSIDQLNSLEADTAFMQQLEQVYAKFSAYMAEGEKRVNDRIAYFSMEFGLHDTLKIFSGGLGMLAGDHLKEASDQNLNMIGVGLLYRYGYFQQVITATGEQVSRFVPQKFSHMPVTPVRDEDGNWVHIVIALPGRNLNAKVWRVDVGRVPLYLLDADIEENAPVDRFITHQLYGGDNENRLKQEMLLGVGGIRLLDALKIAPQVYHCNEGHAAFIGLERLRVFIQDLHMSFDKAKEVVRNSTLFTTHTPVPAGHDTFDEHLLRAYMPHYADRLHISWEQFMGLGRYDAGNTDEKFSMSLLAMRLSLEVNGVSRIHGRVSQEMFSRLYPGYFPQELHIGYVTNGVHFPSWASSEWKNLYENTFGPEFMQHQSDPELWKKIYDVADEKLWDIRKERKHIFIEYLRKRLGKDMKSRQESPATIVGVLNGLDENALIVGFARRFATYKRAHLLFTDLERLREIVNDKQRPVVFVFAGKAHPNDKAGQDLIKRIIEISRQKDFQGKVVFVENYDIELGHMLVQSVDVWLNNPTRPLEASGTSGEKAIMNGVLNFSVLDGWWAEGYREGAGWALPEERAYVEQSFQDQLDAASMYNTFEDEIIRLYYQRDKNGVPVEWINYIKNNIAQIAPHFTMKRQVDDYTRLYYSKLLDRSKKFNEENFRMASEMSDWKQKVKETWPNIKLKWIKVPDSNRRPLSIGETFKAEVCIDTAGLKHEELGVELIFARKVNDRVNEYDHLVELELVEKNEEKVYTCGVEAKRAGVHDYAFRIYPKHPGLGHRQDLELIRWI